jgi:hypothetical protein
MSKMIPIHLFIGQKYGIAPQRTKQKGSSSCLRAQMRFFGRYLPQN